MMTRYPIGHPNNSLAAATKLVDNALSWIDANMRNVYYNPNKAKQRDVAISLFQEMVAEKAIYRVLYIGSGNPRRSPVSHDLYLVLSCYPNRPQAIDVVLALKKVSRCIGEKSTYYGQDESKEENTDD